MLGHAVEYLADEHALECMSERRRLAGGLHPKIEAIELLMERNREVYYECPVIPTVRERLRTMLGLAHRQKAE
jgi:hypothetical protein